MQQIRPQALVTGASGFLGRSLVRRLGAAGFEVRGLDLVPGGGRTGDVRRGADVAALVPARGVVFHLASIVGVAHVLARPARTWSTTVEGTEVVCRAALDRGARVVFTSSSEVYGGGTALGEEAPLPGDYGSWPRASYPASKRVAEEIVLDFCSRGGDGRIARLFNVSGPGQRGDGGMVLPTFVGQALAGKPLTVVGDGSDVRCFQHVEDAVRGLVALAGDKGAPGLTVNLGGRDPVRIRWLADRVRSLLGSRSRVCSVSYAERYGQPAARCPCRVPDTSRAAVRLGHEPVRGLDEIVLDLAAAEGWRPCAASPVALTS